MGENDRARVRCAAALALFVSAAAVRSAQAEPNADRNERPRVEANGGSTQSDDARVAALADHLEQLFAAGIEASSAHGVALSLGSAGERALIELFERTSAARYVRLRALIALLDFESSASARYFERLVAAAHAPKDGWLGELHPARSSLVLRRALEGLRQNAHLLEKPPALDPIARSAAHADAHVRRAASGVLAVLGDRRATAVLSARLESERSRMVRASLERALTSRSARQTAPR